VQDPVLRKVTFPVSGATEHTAGVDVVTDFTPSPVVVTAAVNEPFTAAELGRFETVGADGAGIPTVKDCESPSRAPKFVPAATRATSVHVPADTNDTMDPLTVHTANVNDDTDFTPSPVVVTAAVNEPFTAAELGRFETVGADGVPLPTMNDCEGPSPAW